MGVSPRMHVDPWATLLPARTASPEETEALGRRLAEALEPGEVVALYGDLGAGKTCLVRGLAAGLGADPEGVTSPTFTLVQTYAGRVPVHHLDVYRIESEAALDALGLEELLDSEDAVALVEWPERMEDRLPRHVRRLRLTHVGRAGREVSLG